MAGRLVIAVDLQKDFIDGALGSAEAQKIVDRCEDKLKKAKEAGDLVVFTRDTHKEDYMDTEEGKNLPVPHCRKNTEGWEIHPSLTAACPDAKVLDKETFGSRALGELAGKLYLEGKLESVELFGLCTDICVISNALLVKAFCPDLPVYVDASCSAGVTPESHDTALKAMKSCQIHITGEGEEPWR